MTLYETYPHKDKISKAVFRKILQTYHKNAAEDLFEGKILKFPFASGVLGIVKVQRPAVSTDYRLSEKFNTHLRHANHHSDGHIVFSRWLRPGYPSFLRGSFKFRFKRSVARMLAKQIKEQGIIYKFIDRHDFDIN